MKIMNIKKKIYGAVLTAALLLSFAACSGSDNTNTTATNANNANGDGTVESTTEAEAVKLDFKGATLNLYSRWETDPSHVCFEWIAEEENGDVVNDAMYKRNKAVEDKLNITINAIKGPGFQEYDDALASIRNSIASGDNMYDLIAGWSPKVPALAIEGLLANLYDVPNLDLSQKWWNPTIRDELTIKNKLYFAAGDANLSTLSSCAVLFVNNKIQQEYSLNIYETVFDGKWTLDKMYEVSKDIYQDLDGNGKKNNKDQLGLVWEKWNGFDGFMQAAGLKIISKDKDGVPYLNAEVDKMALLVEKVYHDMYENPGALVLEEGQAPNIFKNNQALIFPGWLQRAQELRDMESDYSVIPFPKLDDNQDKYYSRIIDGVSLLCLPVNITDERKEMVGAFMEAMGEESYNTLSPAYFEVALKVKYTRDDSSGKMLDIIREGAYANFASIYNNNLGAPWDLMRDLMNAKKNNFASWWESHEGVIEQSITKLMEQIEANE